MAELDDAWLKFSTNVAAQNYVKASLPPEPECLPPQPEQMVQYTQPKSSVIPKRRPRAVVTEVVTPPSAPNPRPMSILKNRVYENGQYASPGTGETQIAEYQQLKIIKPSIKGEYSFKHYVAEFSAYLNGDYQLFSRRIHAINQIISVTKAKYMQTISKVRDRIVYLQKNTNELNVKLLAYRQKQYVLVLIKSNWKLKQLREKLVKAMYISNLEIKYAYCFRLMGHISSLSNTQAKVSFSLYRYFQLFIEAYKARNCNISFADYVAAQRLKRYGFAVLMISHTYQRLICVADYFFEYLTSIKVFSHMKYRIRQKIYFRNALLGVREAQYEVASLDVFLEAFKRYNGSLLSSLILAVQYFSAIIGSHVIGRRQTVVLQRPQECTCTCDMREIMPEHVCAGCACGKCYCYSSKAKLSGRAAASAANALVCPVVSQKLAVFHIPDVPIKVARKAYAAERFYLSYHRQLQREVYNQKFNVDGYKRLLYVSSEPGNSFKIAKLDPEIQRLLGQLKTEQVVQMCSNLFAMAKALSYWRLEYKQLKLQTNVDQQIAPLLLSKRLIRAWKRNVRDQKLLENYQADHFAARTLMYRHFSQMRILGRQLLTPAQQRRADKFFKLIIVSRMLREWKRLSAQTSQRQQNLMILIQLLPEITLLKPAFLHWQAMTQILVESRKKANLLTERAESRLYRLVLLVLGREARKRILLREVLPRAVMQWWARDEYEYRDLARDCFIGWRVLVDDPFGVKMMGVYRAYRLQAYCLYVWRASAVQVGKARQFDQQRTEECARRILVYFWRKNFTLGNATDRAVRLWRASIQRQALHAMMHVFLVRISITRPLVKNDVFYKWRVATREARNIAEMHERMLMRVALRGVLRFLDLYRKGVVVMDNHEYLLLYSAFAALAEVFQQCRIYDQQRNEKLVYVADAHYLMCLQYWAAGKRNLVSNERLWDERLFYQQFSESSGQRAVEELAKYTALHRLQIQFQAFFEWMRYVQ